MHRMPMNKINKGKAEEPWGGGGGRCCVGGLPAVRCGGSMAVSGKYFPSSMYRKGKIGETLTNLHGNGARRMT